MGTWFSSELGKVKVAKKRCHASAQLHGGQCKLILQQPFPRWSLGYGINFYLYLSAMWELCKLTTALVGPKQPLGLMVLGQDSCNSINIFILWNAAASHY